MITVQQISNQTGLKINFIYKRLRELEIEPRKKIRYSGYYDKDIIELFNGECPKYYNKSTLKLKVIEYYVTFRNQPIKNIADELGITYNRLQTIIRDYRNNDYCITIKSKL